MCGSSQLEPSCSEYDDESECVPADTEANVDMKAMMMTTNATLALGTNLIDTVGTFLKGVATNGNDTATNHLVYYLTSTYGVEITILVLAILFLLLYLFNSKETVLAFVREMLLTNQQQSQSIEIGEEQCQRERLNQQPPPEYSVG